MTIGKVNMFFTVCVTAFYVAALMEVLFSGVVHLIMNLILTIQ